MATYSASVRSVSEQSLRRLAIGFGEQALWFVHHRDPENAGWAATLAAHYARLAIERMLGD